MIRVTFKCLHASVAVEAALSEPPVCPVCGERQIANTQAPPPRFRGVGAGPLMKG